MALFHQCDEECHEYTDVDHPIPGRWKIDGIEYNRCPLTTINKNVFWFVRAFNFMSKGILPNSGGWLEQSGKFIDVMSFISNKIGEHQAEQRAKNGNK